jgi:hypothetical protein
VAVLATLLLVPLTAFAGSITNFVWNSNGPNVTGYDLFSSPPSTGNPTVSGGGNKADAFFIWSSTSVSNVSGSWSLSGTFTSNNGNGIQAGIGSLGGAGAPTITGGSITVTITVTDLTTGTFTNTFYSTAWTSTNQPNNANATSPTLTTGDTYKVTINFQFNALSFMNAPTTPTAPGGKGWDLTYQ